MSIATTTRFARPTLFAGFALLLAITVTACSERETAEVEENQETTVQQEAEQETNLWGDWNADGNTDLSAEEWNQGFRNTSYYDEWDANQDDAVQEEEFQEGLFDFLDADDDGTLLEDDWEEAQRWFNDEVGTWDEWDTDASGDIDQNEWNTGWQESQTWNDWDADASGDLNQDEFSESHFRAWDENDDEVLTEDEFNRANDALGFDRNRVGGRQDGTVNRTTQPTTSP